MRLKQGEVQIKWRPSGLIRLIENLLTVESHGVNVAVKGTEFTVRYDEATQTTFVTVIEGEVLVTPNSPTLGAVRLRAPASAQVTPTSITTFGNSEPATSRREPARHRWRRRPAHPGKRRALAVRAQG